MKWSFLSLSISAHNFFPKKYDNKSFTKQEKKLGTKHKHNLSCSSAGYWVVFVPILHNSIYFQYRFPSHVISPLTYIYSKSCIRCVKQIFSFSSNCENMCTMFTFHLVLVLYALCPRNVAKKFYKYASVQTHTASTRHACTHAYGH